MLVIRKEQIAVFEEIAQKNFERELADHIRKFIPKHAEAVGDGQLKETVNLGVERAREYGFTNRAPVQFYIEMMCLFGCDFDTDPQLPWAQAILKDDAIADQAERADALFDKMTEYDEKVCMAADGFAASVCAAGRGFSSIFANVVDIQHRDISMRWSSALFADALLRRGDLFLAALSRNQDGWRW